VDVILGNVFDDIARLCKGRVLLATQSELLAVISVAEESARSMRRRQQAGRLHESASRSLRYEIEACFPVTGALLTRACRCGWDRDIE
jgi:hypothetical protein